MKRTLLTVLAVSFSASLALAETPNPNELYFHSNITYGGSGCPSDTVSAAVSEDGQAISIFFDSYIAEVGPTTSAVVSKACSLSLPLHIPAGWQYSLVDLTYRGYLYLDPQVRAEQTSEYYFQGSVGPKFQSVWNGPADHDFTFTDKIGILSVNYQWSPCNVQRNLNIHTTLKANNTRNRKGTGLVTTDSIDGEIEHIYGMVWRRCS
jgi:hypothetical protein